VPAGYAAGIQVVLAAGRTRRLRGRVNGALDHLAAGGRPAGGHPLGYRHSVDAEGRATLEIVPEIAEQIRWSAEKVLAGWSLEAIAREMQARRVPTRYGGAWSHSNVKGMLTNPTVAGFRVHKGQVVRRGNWEPILDETTWRTLCARLSGPRHRPARTYLLSGIAICGRCGHGLTGRIRQAHGKADPLYFCHPTTGGCGRLGILAAPLEDHVVGELFDALDSDKFRAALAEDDHQTRRATLAAELEQIDARHVELAQRWATGALPSTAWDEARVALEQRSAQVQADLAAVPAPMADIDPATVRSSWGPMALDERRTVVELFIASVTVAPATPGAKVVDLGRVTIKWKGDRFS
jgi:site-specific DNA recombinase